MSALLIGLIAGVVCYLDGGHSEGARSAMTIRSMPSASTEPAGRLARCLRAFSRRAWSIRFSRMRMAMPCRLGWIEGNCHQIAESVGGRPDRHGCWRSWERWILLKLVDTLMGLRVTEEEEVQGLDLTQHGEEGYYWEASLP